MPRGTQIILPRHSKGGRLDWVQQHIIVVQLHLKQSHVHSIHAYLQSCIIRKIKGGKSQFSEFIIFTLNFTLALILLYLFVRQLRSPSLSLCLSFFSRTFFSFFLYLDRILFLTFAFCPELKGASSSESERHVDAGEEAADERLQEAPAGSAGRNQWRSSRQQHYVVERRHFRVFSFYPFHFFLFSYFYSLFSLFNFVFNVILCLL